MSIRNFIIYISALKYQSRVSLPFLKTFEWHVQEPTELSVFVPYNVAKLNHKHLCNTTIHILYKCLTGSVFQWITNRCFIPFQVSFLVLYPLKTSEKFWFDDVFRDLSKGNICLKWDNIRDRPEISSLLIFQLKHRLRHRLSPERNCRQLSVRHWKKNNNNYGDHLCTKNCYNLKLFHNFLVMVIFLFWTF